MAKMTTIYFFILINVDNYQYLDLKPLVGKETHSTSLLHLKEGDVTVKLIWPHSESFYFNMYSLF